MRALRPERLELIDALVAETALGGITAGLLLEDASAMLRYKIQCA